MAVPDGMPDELVELIARRFRVIGDPMRIRILNELRTGELSVSELVARTGGGQQNVSKHLGVLHEARIVERRKQGIQALYSILDDTVYRLCDEVCGSIQRQVHDLSQRLNEHTL